MTKYKLAAAMALTSTLALAACGSGTVDADADGDGTITTSEVEAAVADLRPEPGQYSATMTLVKMDIPGAPQEMVEALSSIMNRTFEYCLSPEDAEAGFEGALMQGQDENCSIDKFDLAGTEVDMEMSCSSPEQGELKMVMNGTVSPTRSDIKAVTTGTLPQIGDANIEMSMVQERLGDCES